MKITRPKILVLVLWIVFGLTPHNLFAADNLQHYRMVSTVEYTGEGQFRNQVETLFTVKRQAAAAGVVNYYLESDGLEQLSFTVDRDAQKLSAGSEGIEFFAAVANNCVREMNKVTEDSVGKTWKQTISLASFPGSLPEKISFTLTAMKVNNTAYGDMIAVRALSEPFPVIVSDGTVTSRINTVYLFDAKIEDIYLSVSVYESMARFNGVNETLRYELATYKTDSDGKALQINNLGKDFGQFVNCVGLSRTPLEVTQKASLPAWAKSDGIAAAQVATICSSTACEGALNPVAMISIPAAKVIELQKESDVIISGNTNLAAAGSPNIWQQLVDKHGFWPAAGIVGGVAVGGVAAAGGFGGGGGGSTAASP